MTPIEASVVICAYTFDRWDELKAAVASVCRQSVPVKEILVVIDYNVELQERATREIKEALVVPNTKAKGLAGGRMTGAELATGSVVVFLDDDAFAADEDWLANLLEPYRDERVLGVGGKVEPHWTTRKPWWFPEQFDWIVGCTFKGMPMRSLPEGFRSSHGRVRGLIGANMSVRKDLLIEAGGFTTSLGKNDGGQIVLGVVAETGEETELCIRMSQQYPNGIWVHCPDSRVKHMVPASRATWKYFVKRCRMEGSCKAIISGLAGSRDGLAAERRYVMNLAMAVLRYTVTGRIGRAASICIGLGITTTSFMSARRAINKNNLLSDRVRHAL
jgi:cellulose synthase/poly-beta-1,6-N-acetylglucosamine synthase-like glycosyltransferase